jgi:hypothetical protein
MGISIAFDATVSKIYLHWQFELDKPAILLVCSGTLTEII